MYFTFIFIAIGLIALVDLYFYRSMRQVVKGPQRDKNVPKWLRYTYWGFTIFTILFFFFAMYFYIVKEPPPRFARIYITGFIFITLISKIIGIIFFLLDDLKDGILYLKRLIFNSKKSLTSTNNEDEGKISRGAFLKQSGLVVSALPFVTMMYGVVRGAFDYNVIKVKVRSPKIPKSFNGYRIVQVSDIHSGSFIMHDPLIDAVRMINEQEPDVLFFTGDLVNEVAEEALPFRDIFADIQTKDGIYSVLGNHDYGDYFYQRGDIEGKQYNRELMRKIHAEMGWDLLLNENRRIERNGEHIGIVGVENWGSSARFQKYGDVGIASKGINTEDFNILLSHDPSHWNSIVSFENPEIDLTLSGHTHGFQMGIEIPGYVKWSPSKYLYDQWAGLYHRNDQQIYVNRGLGFLGYPGRLGIRPEITVIELESSSQA